MKFKQVRGGFAMLGLLFVSSLALARGPVDFLAERLDLSAEQAATISALFEDHRDYVHNEIQWRDAEGNPDPQAREQVRAAREALDQEILAVLDPAQAEEYERIKERRARHRAREHRGHRLAHALGQLDLSEEQKEAIRTLMAERKFQRMREGERFRDDLAAILSEEQLAELQAMREQRRARRKP